jgi:EmrB/QacA subfamily drug resistance transporter
MDEAEGTLAGAGAGRALATITAILFLTFLDTTIVSVALSDVQSSLHAGVTSLQWVVNAYALLFASLMLIAGTLGDRLGRKRVMLCGVAVFVAGSLLGALAPNTPTLIGARAIMGVGAAACEPGTLSVIRHLYPQRAARARALGLWAAVAGLALAMGPVLGGLLVGAGGWRAIFWFNLGAGVLAFAAALVTVPESADPQSAHLDFVGFLLAPTALGTLIFAIIFGETAGYGAAQIIALFAIAAAASLAFLLVERRSRSPMLDVAYLRKPAFSGSLAVAFAAYFGVFSIFFLTALYLQAVIGYSAFRTAAVFAPMALAMIIASALAGRWVARAGPRLPVVIGCLASGLGVLLADASLGGRVGFLALALSLTVSGFGFGIVVVPVTSVALALVPAAHSGMAASATTTSREIGAVVGVATLGSLFNGELTAHLTQRLIALGVPPAFRSIVINAVETGQVPSGGKGASSAQQAYGPIVAKVIDAAYGAFHTGLNLALIVAGCVILVSGLLAWLTFSPTHLAAEVED